MLFFPSSLYLLHTIIRRLPNVSIWVKIDLKFGNHSSSILIPIFQMTRIRCTCVCNFYRTRKVRAWLLFWLIYCLRRRFWFCHMCLSIVNAFKGVFFSLFVTRDEATLMRYFWKINFATRISNNLLSYLLYL